MADSMRTGTLRRLLRLWWLYGRMDLLWMLRDARLFFTYALSDIITNIGSVTAMLLLAERFQGIGPWTQWQVVFLLGYAMVVNASMNMFFQYNVLHISRRIGRGQMDHTLIQPQPLWMALLTEGFMPFSGSAMLWPGLGLLVWALVRLQMTITIGWLAAAVLNLVASALVMLSFSFVWGSLAFWTPRAAEEISSATVDLVSALKGFPLDALGPLLSGALLTVLPVGLVAWYPSRCLVGLDSRPWALWVTPLAAVAGLALAGLIFWRGLKHYANVGSQRYSAFGHRS